MTRLRGWPRPTTTCCHRAAAQLYNDPAAGMIALMAGAAESVHLNLDGAWEEGILGIPVRDLRSWGPRLRYHGTRAGVEEFYREVAPHLAPFVLYGSGDYHYLAAVLLRRVPSPLT